MKKVIEKVLIGIVLPFFVQLLEETIKLIMEAINDESLNKKEKIQYVINGITGKIENIKSVKE